MQSSRTRSGHSSQTITALALLGIAMFVLTVPIHAAVVINEVLYDPAGDDDGEERIEFYNSGGSPVDLTGQSMCVFPSYWDLPAITMNPGDYIVIRWNTTGTDGPHEFFTGPMGGGFRELGDEDSIGFYSIPVSSGAYGSPENVEDFVQWGAGNQGRSNVAQLAGIWTDSDFIAAVAEGKSLALSPDGDDRNNSTNWIEMDSSFGGGNAVPVEAATWGRIKDLYSN